MAGCGMVRLETTTGGRIRMILILLRKVVEERLIFVAIRSCRTPMIKNLIMFNWICRPLIFELLLSATIDWCWQVSGPVTRKV